MIILYGPDRQVDRSLLLADIDVPRRPITYVGVCTDDACTHTCTRVHLHTCVRAPNIDASIEGTRPNNRNRENF